MRLWVAVFLAIVAASPAYADGHQPGATALYMAQTCLQSGDAAFEQSLQDGIGDADRAALTGLYATATFECLGFAMEICEAREEALACLQDLAVWIRATRAEIAAGLPEEIEGVAGYSDALGWARADADPDHCREMTQTQRARYCDVVAEGMALEDAYQASRLARRAGGMALEGHGPVDLEIIR